MVAAAVGGAALVGGIYSSRKQGQAAGRAADAQSQAALAGIDEQARQFDQTKELLAPWVNAGQDASGQLWELAGLNGTRRQRLAIEGLQAGPEYTAALKAGENAILQNASATGGLRGGNTQGALAQFRPQLLADVINQRYARLGQISSNGLNAAGGLATVGQNSANATSNLLQQQGAAQAGGYLAQGNTYAGYANAITGAIGMYGGLGGFGGGGAGTVTGGTGIKF